MSFPSGSVSFRRFTVTGQHPKSIEQSHLDGLTEFTLKESEYTPEEIEYGWSGGRHIFDSKFSFEHNVFADALHFALRIDTNRVPSAHKRAYQIIEEENTAATNPSGHISKLQKREVKDVVRRKIDEDLRSGRFRRSKLVPILWDFPGHTLYSSASSSDCEKLFEIFERTFSLTLDPLSTGSIAQRYFEKHHKKRDYEDLRPTRFVPGPEGENQHPEYPWCLKGPQPKDFLGNEFLLWLWHHIETRGGTIKTDEANDVAIVIDRSLELDCAYGQTGKDSLRGDGPTRMPEARDALRSGKLPRRAGFLLENGGHQFQFTLAAESLALSSAILPDVEEAEDARVLFEERIGMLRDLSQSLDALFHTFLKLRTTSWESQVTAIRNWIQKASKHAAA